MNHSIFSELPWTWISREIELLYDLISTQFISCNSMVWTRDVLAVEEHLTAWAIVTAAIEYKVRIDLKIEILFGTADKCIHFGRQLQCIKVINKSD